MEKIFIALIEGTRVYVPVDAVLLNDSTYQIVHNEHEDPTDATLIWQFFTGDIVKCAEREGALYATELVESTVPMRTMHELVFLIMDNEGRLTKEQVVRFTPELETLCKITLAQQKYPILKQWLAGNCECE